MTRLCMQHNILVGWHDFEIILIIPADLCSLYLILPSLSTKYEYPCFLFVPMPLIFSNLRRLFLRCSSDNIKLVVTLAFPEVAMLAGARFLLYATEVVVPDY